MKRIKRFKINRITFLPVAFVSLIILGTLGYVVIEHVSLLNALYMTIITMSTVGYKEVVELSPAGKIFTISFIISAMITVFVGFGLLTYYLLEGELTRSFEKRRTEKRIAKMEGHYIICGYGRIGKWICHELARNGAKFVVVEKEPCEVESAGDEGLVCTHGDATEEEILRKAGVERAKGLVAALASDADNIFAILTARELNPNLFIIARAIEESAETKLYRAGANRVFSPYRIEGLRIANAILRPTVYELLERVMFDEKQKKQAEQVYIPVDSWIVGKTIMESQLRSEYGFIVIGTRKKDGELIFNPTPEHKIEAGDQLVVIGELGELDKFRKTLL